MCGVCGDALRASMSRDPIDEGGSCERERVWLANDMNRYRDDYDRLRERRNETCDVDLKGDRETCTGDGTDQGQSTAFIPLSISHDLHDISFKVHIRHRPVLSLNPLFHPPVRQLQSHQ